ncbi:hypothetical protein IEQ34_016707 [Dendrobium chrysotoxum]|uniref:non-specific serine/threonine protein kinase n=1 Tax=Dendrobium chrysotoxum TaxID=161865 RepID=A0AAV7GGC9_DENCH|nr:hypothetical protein IEQ34_016707 [Dendrobium chrysotoxum]
MMKLILMHNTNSIMLLFCPMHCPSPQPALLRHRMSPPNSPLFLFSLLTIILSITVQTFSQDDQNNPFVTDCNGENFTLSSPYDSNLRLLLHELINSTPNSSSFFFLNNSTSPQIFGLAQCRPDITPAVCSACLNQSAVDFFNHKGCGLKKSFANRAGNCLLRYSDQTFYNSLDYNLFVWYPYTENATASFNSRVNILMKRVMASAAAATLKFAVRVSNESVDEPDIYGMGWCSLDLASSDCDQCLSKAFVGIPSGKTHGSGAYVSCHLRFETYQFYSNSLLLPAPAPEAGGKISTNKRSKTVAVVAGISGAVALLLFCTFFILLQRQRKRKLLASEIRYAVDEEEVLEEFEVKMIDFCAIKNATNNFAKENKLGEGGFGPVYKGVLMNGQEIAVKRLSTTSRQGLQEMKNEINFTAKLQHKNLVRLLGYCLEQEEKLLVYEFLPNTSLDKFLFGMHFVFISNASTLNYLIDTLFTLHLDCLNQSTHIAFLLLYVPNKLSNLRQHGTFVSTDPVRGIQIGWETRLKIIIGIGRGLLYLHEDSRLRIVHRDLKAGNILLDSDMNPKISDFGLAKLFGADETERNTTRVCGTFGYMAPEYALHGFFSTKSDVYSFGMLILEIITGEKCTEPSEQTVSLLSYVWKHWKQGKALEIIDKRIDKRYLAQEALRVIQIALLCVQEQPIQRPNMAFIMGMLCTSSMKLPIPPTPVYYSGTNISVDSKAVARITNLAWRRINWMEVIYSLLFISFFIVVSLLHFLVVISSPFLWPRVLRVKH